MSSILIGGSTGLVISKTCYTFAHMAPIIFAVLAAFSFGLWTVFHKLAAPHINQVLGAIIVSFVAVLFGLLSTILQPNQFRFEANQKGLLFVALAGVCAFLIDFFALKTYANGLPVTVGGPIIIGGSIAVAVVIGFFMGDSVTAMKIFGLLLLVAGAAILSAVS